MAVARRAGTAQPVIVILEQDRIEPVMRRIHDKCANGKTADESDSEDHIVTSRLISLIAFRFCRLRAASSALLIRWRLTSGPLPIL